MIAGQYLKFYECVNHKCRLRWAKLHHGTPSSGICPTCLNDRPKAIFEVRADSVWDLLIKVEQFRENLQTAKDNSKS